MLRNELDKKAILYESGPLAEGMEVTGHPILRVWIGADRDDADIFVYLSDVDEKGDVHYVAEGQLRSSFHTLGDPSLQVGGRLEVRPELPWHGYRAPGRGNGALCRWQGSRAHDRNDADRLVFSGWAQDSRIACRSGSGQL